MLEHFRKDCRSYVENVPSMNTILGITLKLKERELGDGYDV